MIAVIAFFCEVGDKLGQILTESPIVGQACQAVCVPDVGLHLLIMEDTDNELYLLGVVHQEEDGVPWVIQPSTATTLRSLQGQDDVIPFRFASPGKVTVFIMRVTEEVVQEVTKLDFLARCSAEDLVRWRGQDAKDSYAFSCVVRPNEEASGAG